MSKFKILFKMTGSISCYKACQLISRLTQSNYEVQVVATSSSMHFIGPATIEGLTGRPIICDLYSPGNVMDHIHLDRWADLVVVAPATANYINKIAVGLADDLPSALCLAHDRKKPYLIAPAMNTAMYSNQITQSNLVKLQNMGFVILPTASGKLACGETGDGRLLEPDEIFQNIQNYLSTTESFKKVDLGVTKRDAEVCSLGASQGDRQIHDGNRSKQNCYPQDLRVLITTGGTITPIDDVRYIGNTSTGKTGVRVAEFLRDLGLPVTLVHSKSSPHTHGMNHQLNFLTFDELSEILQQELSARFYTHVIHLAAVSDYRVAGISTDHSKLELSAKLPSGVPNLCLHLQPTFKIVDELREYSLNKNIKVIAFKLTSHASKQNRQLAVTHLFEHSQADWIVHNDMADFSLETNCHPYNIYNFEPNDIDKRYRWRGSGENVEMLAEHLYNIITLGEITQ